VAHVLRVAAIQLGDPVVFGILVETNDASLHVLVVGGRWSVVGGRWLLADNRQPIADSR
jgi:hypothetical protein